MEVVMKAKVIESLCIGCGACCIVDEEFENSNNSIINSLLNDEIYQTEFLSKHKITERMRTRMVDWMIEVLTNYHCDQSTFFEAVNLMDRYFKAAGEKGQCFNPEELHFDMVKIFQKQKTFYSCLSEKYNCSINGNEFS